MSEKTLKDRIGVTRHEMSQISKNGRVAISDHRSFKPAEKTVAVFVQGQRDSGKDLDCQAFYRSSTSTLTLSRPPKRKA